FGGYIVATDRSRFAMPESRLGFLPDVGATFEMKHRLGLPLARYFAWAAESFDGEQAVRWGFADALVGRDQIETLLVSLSRAASGSGCPEERAWAAATLATIKRRSPVTIWASDLLLNLDHERLAQPATAPTEWLADLKSELRKSAWGVAGFAESEPATPRALA